MCSARRGQPRPRSSRCGDSPRGELRSTKRDERKFDDRSPTIPLLCSALDPEKGEAGLVTLDCALDVHGGITYSNWPHDPDLEAYEKMVSFIPKRREEAQERPEGYSAKWLREWIVPLRDFETYAECALQRFICIVPQVGKSRWLFGFDCGHHRDVHPAWDRSWSPDDGSYKDIEYVTREVTGLARQLADWR